MEIVFAQRSQVSELENIIQSTFHLACPKSANADLQSCYIAKNLSAQHFEQLIRSTRHIVLVAQGKQAVIGLAVIEQISNSVACLSKLYVLLSYQRKGVAHCLFHEVMQQVKKLNVNRLRLSVYSGNLKAKAFYEKQGFNQVGHCDFTMETEVHQDHVYVNYAYLT